MNRYEHLKLLLEEDDEIGFLAWLSDFADWYDPGGWFGIRETKRYLNEENTDLNREFINWKLEDEGIN